MEIAKALQVTVDQDDQDDSETLSSIVQKLDTDAPNSISDTPFNYTSTVQKVKCDVSPFSARSTSIILVM